MKQESKDLIRNMLAGRIAWMADQIAKGAGDAGQLSADLVAVTAALADLVTPATAAAPSKGDNLLDVLSSPPGLMQLAEIANTVLNVQGKSSTYQFIASVRAHVADPSSERLPLPQISGGKTPPPPVK